jgi:hypothetical protein
MEHALMAGADYNVSGNILNGRLPPPTPVFETLILGLEFLFKG